VGSVNFDKDKMNKKMQHLIKIDAAFKREGYKTLSREAPKSELIIILDN
jgi:hypothetical protein